MKNISTSGTVKDYAEWLKQQFKKLSPEKQVQIREAETERVNREWNAIPKDRQDELTAELEAIRSLRKQSTAKAGSYSGTKAR